MSVLFSLQEHTLTGLNTYTQYLVSLRVFNPEGNGPETIVVVMTDEGGKANSEPSRQTNARRFRQSLKRASGRVLDPLPKLDRDK